jgi:hypothetical protein
LIFAKVLMANRGEIAVRTFRAAYELGAGTVAVFPWEDRNSVHRLKADESCQISEPGHPVRAYLSVDEIVGAARNRRRRLPSGRSAGARCLGDPAGFDEGVQDRPLHATYLPSLM